MNFSEARASAQGKIRIAVLMRVSKLLMITKWRLSQPEMAQEPLGAPSDATNALLDIYKGS